MIQKIALIGAGAIGAYFIDCLDEKKDIELNVIAEGKRKERLIQEGIYVNDHHYDLNVKEAKECGCVDLILVATKYSGIQEARDLLPLLIKEDTLVLSLLNGVDSEEILAKKIGREHIVDSLMRISSQRVGQSIHYTLGPSYGLFYGSEDQNKIDRLNEFFSTTKIQYHPIENIRVDMWTKYASNIANNLPQAILQIPGVLYTNEHGLFMVSHLWEEVRQVALAKGIEIAKEPIIFNGLKAKYSTLQDIEAKRHTEVDMFLGVLILMAKEYSIPVPYSEYTYHLIKALELKNDGYFD